MTSIRKTWLGVGLVVAAVVVIVAAIALSNSDTPCGELNLSSARWSPASAARAKNGEPSVRQQIAGDILRCNALQADSKDEVLRKIGRPNGSKASRNWEWMIGKDRSSGGFPGIGTEVITIEFDARDRVQRVFTSRR